jgi:hypothetical protein
VRPTPGTCQGPRDSGDSRRNSRSRGAPGRQGVGVTTAVLPHGWRERVAVFETHGTALGRGLCLEPHDCVLVKLATGREKDYAFATALADAGLIDPP